MSAFRQTTICPPAIRAGFGENDCCPSTPRMVMTIGWDELPEGGGSGLVGVPPPEPPQAAASTTVPMNSQKGFRIALPPRLPR
jgi:hypothetical protein